MKILLPLLAAAAGLTSVAAAAQTNDPRHNERVRQVIVYGNDQCPQGSSDEIVVCARRPDSDRYRIPEALRENRRSPDGKSWAYRAEDLETMGDSGIGSCSTTGPGGASGCWNQMVDQHRRVRREPNPPE
jgi:hypothetical protein